MTDATTMENLTYEIHGMKVHLLKLKLRALQAERKSLCQQLKTFAHRRRRSWYCQSQVELIRHKLKIVHDRRVKLEEELKQLRKEIIIELPF